MWLSFLLMLSCVAISTFFNVSLTPLATYVHTFIVGYHHISLPYSLLHFYQKQKLYGWGFTFASCCFLLGRFKRFITEWMFHFRCSLCVPLKASTCYVFYRQHKGVGEATSAGQQLAHTCMKHSRAHTHTRRDRWAGRIVTSPSSLIIWVR